MKPGDVQPVIFQDGTEFFKNFANTFIKHDKGFFILAPSGAGKTHFCQQQAEPPPLDRW